MELRGGRVSPHGHGQLGDAEAGPFGAEDELGVEEILAALAGVDQRGQIGPAQRLHTVGVAHRQAEAGAQDEGEDGGDGPAAERPGVIGTGAPLAGHDHGGSVRRRP